MSSVAKRTLTGTGLSLLVVALVLWNRQVPNGGVVWGVALVLSALGAIELGRMPGLAVPRLTAALLVAAVRRDYFQAVQGGIPSGKEITSSDLPTFGDELGGIAYLPRIIRKARAKLRVSLETLDSPLARALWWKLERHPLVWQKNLGSTIYSVIFSPDGLTLAAGCQDGSIYLIDVRTLEVRFLRGHLDQIFALDFSPDGKQLASGAWNGEVRLWHVARGTSVAWRAHKALVWGIRFSPNGRELATAAYDGNIRIWKATDAHPKRLEFATGHRVSAP